MKHYNNRDNKKIILLLRVEFVMTEFQDKILQYSKEIEDKIEHIDNEETTKVALIFPFFRLMGYDTTDPQEFKTEYVADIGAKKGEKADIAIFRNNEVIMIVECKPTHLELGKDQISQLYRYFNITPARIGILTNGIHYYFYTDIQRKGMMDETPFLEIDITNPTKRQIKELENFTKENYNLNTVLKRVDDLKYSNDLRKVIQKELDNPSKEFISVLAKQVFDGILTKRVQRKFSKLIKTEFNRLVNEMVNERLNDALESADDEATKDEKEAEDNNLGDGETEEMEGFYIVKSILTDIINPNRISIREAKNYITLLFDDNKYYPICRLHFKNPDRLRIALLKDYHHKQGRREYDLFDLDSTDEIYNYKEKLVELITYYVKMKK